MAVKLLSFLGTGKYDECVYYFNDIKSNPTKYIQSALVQVMNKLELNIDEVCIFLTPEAREAHWEESEENHLPLSKQLTSLSEELPFEIKDISIRFADDIETIWETFSIINNVIEEGDEIIFDITHSFRYQPMLALLALHFLRVTKDVQVLGIYYGVYQNNSETKEFPIIDLTSFSELQDWITNVYSFTQTGRVDTLSDWLNKKGASIRREERTTTVDMKSVSQLSNSWRNLTDTLQTNRSPELKKAAEDALQAIEDIKQHEIRPAFQPLNNLFSKVQKSIEPFTSDDEVLSGFAAIEWCLDHDLLQQAYTMATELAFTAFCKKNQVDPLDKPTREIYTKFFTSIVLINRYTKENHLEKIKSIRLPMIENAFSIKEELIQYPNLLEAFHEISDKRNDINHAGWRQNYLLPTSLKKTFLKKYPEFKRELLQYWNSR